jgi:hypothetical protein
MPGWNNRKLFILPVHCVLLERDGQNRVILASWLRFGSDVLCNGELVVYVLLVSVQVMLGRTGSHVTRGSR